MSKNAFRIKRPELTYEEFCNLPMQYLQGIRLSNKAIRVHGNTEYGIYRQTVTPFRESTWTWGKPKTILYLHPDGEAYDTPDQLYMAYMCEACGVDANAINN